MSRFSSTIPQKNEIDLYIFIKGWTIQKVASSKDYQYHAMKTLNRFSPGEQVIFINKTVSGLFFRE